MHALNHWTTSPGPTLLKIETFFNLNGYKIVSLYD